MNRIEALDAFVDELKHHADEEMCRDVFVDMPVKLSDKAYTIVQKHLKAMKKELLSKLVGGRP